MAGEQGVGGIVGYLRLDADDFHREITRAIAEVKVLNGMEANVHIDAKGARGVERDLLKVGAATRLAGKSAYSAEAAVQGLSDTFGGLTRGGIYSPAVIIGAIVAGLSLLGPVTATAAGAMGGLTGVVGTGVLAFQGFKKEVEEGTALGDELSRELRGLKGGFDALAKTAATSMSGGVLAGLRDVRAFMPSLNGDVATLAASLGRAFQIGTGGLITGLKNAMPLLQDGGKYAEILAQKLADFAASQDFKDFVAYARRELPEVASAIGDIAVGVKDLAVAFAPLGELIVETTSVNGKLMSVLGQTMPLLSGNASAFVDLGSRIAGSNSEMRDGAAAAELQRAAAVNLAAVQTPLATGLGTTDAALAAVAEKNRKTRTTSAEATLQMQLQGDAAGLLKQQLDLLNGKALDLSSAQTTAASSTLALTGSLKQNGTSLSLNTEKGVANRQALEAKARADQAVAEATARATGSTKAGTESLKGSKTALENTLRAQGKLTPAIQAYIDKVYKIPKVAPTKAEFNKTSAVASIKAFQASIDKLHGKTVTATVRYAYEGKLPGGGISTKGGQTFADGGVVRSRIPGYAGGTIIGPGSGRSDSILAGISGSSELIRVSNGEFISTDASRRRNQAALEAANKGATLGVVGSSMGGGTTELGEASLYRLAAILSKRPVVAQVSASQVGSAMAVGL